MIESFDLDTFCEYVARVNSWYLRDKQEQFENSCRYVEWIAQYTGCLLRKKQNKAPLSDYDRNYWGKMLIKQNITNYNIPEECSDSFLLHRCRVYLGYTVSLIVDGHKDLLEKYYLESNVFYTTVNEYEVLFRMAIACYLYYLAEVESKYIVPKRAKECSDFVLSSQKFKIQFTSMLQQVNWSHGIEVYQSFFEKTLEEILHPFERYKEGQVKHLVVEPTVNVFAAFVQSYISDYHFLGSTFIDKTSSEYLIRLILTSLDGENRGQTKASFKRLYELLIITQSNMSAQAKSDSLFYQWEKDILEKHKKEKTLSANEAQKRFIKEKIEEVIKTDVQEHLIDHFQNRFGFLMDQTMIDGERLEFNLMRFTGDTDYFLSQKSLHIVYDNLDGLLLDNIADYLLKTKKILVYDRSGKTDSEFIDYMQNEKIDLLVGSEFNFLEKDYNNYDIIRDFFNKRICVFIGGAKSALAIHNGDLKFAVSNISVSMHEASLDEASGIEYDEETGKYIIRLINNVAEMFTKEEAENYIKNQKKIADVSVTVVVQMPEKAIGFKIER